MDENVRLATQSAVTSSERRMAYPVGAHELARPGPPPRHPGLASRLWPVLHHGLVVLPVRPAIRASPKAI